MCWLMDLFQEEELYFPVAHPNHFDRNFHHHLLFLSTVLDVSYEGKSMSNQPIPFPIDRNTQDFHALFQYMF